MVGRTESWREDACDLGRREHAAKLRGHPVRTASPSMLNDQTAARMASDGNKTTGGHSGECCRPALAITQGWAGALRDRGSSVWWRQGSPPHLQRRVGPEGEPASAAGCGERGLAGDSTPRGRTQRMLQPSPQGPRYEPRQRGNLSERDRHEQVYEAGPQAGVAGISSSRSRMVSPGGFVAARRRDRGGR